MTNNKKLKPVAEQFGLRLVVLYGSHARRRPEPGPASDIDIAVLGCSRDRFWDCYKALSAVIDGEHPLDAVRLEDADALFRYETMHEGRLLYGDPDLFYEYRAYAYRDFIDSADLFALEDALFRKKMSNLEQQMTNDK